MNTYSIPKPEGCTTNLEYQEYCTTLDWQFNGERCVYPDFDKEQVSVDGTISGFTQL